MRFAGKEVTRSQVMGTTLALREYRRKANAGDAFAAGCLAMILHVAINRKAGIPDVPSRKHDTQYQWDLYHDCKEIRDHLAWRRRPWGLNGRRWRTADIQARYGHLLERE